MAPAEKLTITLPKDVVRDVRRAVRRRGGTVSGYVARAVVEYETSQGLQMLLDDLDKELPQRGGSALGRAGARG